MTTTEVPATRKQVVFVKALVSEREMPTDMHKTIDKQLAVGVTKSEARIIIKALLQMPKMPKSAIPTPGTQPVAEHGVYQTPTGEIYVAKWNKAKTHLYAKRLVETGERLTEAGTVVTIDFVYDPGAIYKLTADMKMPVEKAKALTVKYGRCLVCGRKLKAAKSVEQGIGPICLKSFA